MTEKDLILEKAREEAECIVREAKEEAARIKNEYASMVHQQVTLEKCLRQVYALDGWHFFEFYKEDAYGLKKLLSHNRKEQRNSYLNCPFNAIRSNAGSYTPGSITLGTVGLNLIDSQFDKIVRKAIKSGLVHGKQNLLEVFKDVEDQISYGKLKHTFSKEYKALKMEEMELLYELEQLKQKEKEKALKQKALAREEAKAQKEFERELRKAQADEDKARKALEKAELEAAKEKANKERFAKLQEQIEKLKEALKEAEERGQRILSMAQQTRRGWVYIISNIGSFGEGVYKIGLTRRLDPMERVYELGDASVPFPFDVHAFIFSEDAPALETALHQAFDKYKVNSVNWRKEYFKVSLEAIKKKVAELGYEVDWEDYAYAPQFRDSMLRR